MNDRDKEGVVGALLGSLRLSPPGGRWEFTWSRYKRFPVTSGYVLRFFCDSEEAVVASVGAIRCYPMQLKGRGVPEVYGLLQEYFESIVADIGVHALFFCREREKSVLDFVDGAILGGLAAKLDDFMKTKVCPSVYLMPLKGVPCVKAVMTDAVAWVQADCDLRRVLSPYGVHPAGVKNAHFPPFSDFGVKYHKLTGDDSWFLCQSASEVEAESVFKRMAGGLSVILEHPPKGLSAGRRMIGGRANFAKDGLRRLLPRPAIVPPVGSPAEISDGMVRIFESLLIEKADESRIQVSLEYLADAWANTTRLSFINTSIAMDALFGVEGRVRASILAGVKDHGAEVADVVAKYDMILKIRNEILHGEYPSVEACPRYVQFFERFGADPVSEQTVIINACLTDLTR